MPAKAVVVFDPAGMPLANVEPTFCFNGAERKWPLTNQDGYTVLNDFPANASGYLKVVANGFKSYLQLVSLDGLNQTMRINNGPDAPNDIVLPSLSFNKPSRERILNVKANLCNILDATGLPIFEPFISTLFMQDMNRANDWIARLKKAGSTHITVEITGDYDEYLPWYGGRYPIIGLDFTNDIPSFRKFLAWIIAQDLIPIVKSGCDGQNYSSVGKTYGWSWGMQNMPRIYQQLIDFNETVLWSTGYDGCFPDWSEDQLLAFMRMMRECGLLYIDTEFGAGPGESISYCHMGHGSDDWTDDKLGDLDSFSCELQTLPTTPDEVATQIEGMSEVFKRIGPGGVYLHNNKTQLQMYETTAYWSIRKYADEAMTQTISQRALNVGYKTFGNGLP